MGGAIVTHIAETGGTGILGPTFNQLLRKRYDGILAIGAALLVREADKETQQV